MALTTFVHKTHSKVHKFLVKNAVLVLMLLMLIILARGVGQYAFFKFFLPIMLFGNAQFFYRLCSKLCPIMPVNFTI